MMSSLYPVCSSLSRSVIAAIVRSSYCLAVMKGSMIQVGLLNIQGGPSHEHDYPGLMSVILSSLDWPCSAHCQVLEVYKRLACWLRQFDMEQLINEPPQHSVTYLIRPVQSSSSYSLTHVTSIPDVL